MSPLRKIVITSLTFVVLCLGSVSPAVADPVAIGTWYEFSFTGPGAQARGCFPADPLGVGCGPSSGTPTTFAPAPPWTFTAPAGGATFTVTDAFLIGDAFNVLDFGVLIGSTPTVAAVGNCGSDPVPCLANPAVSSGVFNLAAGAHSITIVARVAPFGSGAAYFRVDGGGGPAIPEPATMVLLGTGLAGVGAIVRKRRKANKG